MSTEGMSDSATSPSLPRGLAACRRFLAWIGRVELTLAIAALLIVVFLSIAQALLRYSLGTSLWWAQEVAEITVLVTYFLGISYVFKTRQEIFIESLTTMLPIRLQLVLYVFEQILTFSFATTLLWLIGLFVPTMLNLQTPILGLSGAVIYLSLTLSTVSIAVTSLYYGTFGVWANRRRIDGRDINEVEPRGLILQPWTEPT